MSYKRMALVVALATTGCVTVPKTSSQLVESSKTTQDFCYAMPRAAVGERVADFLGRCYGKVETAIPLGGGYVPMRGDFQVVDEQLAKGNRYSVRNFMGFGYSADVVDGGERCETAVNMYAVTGMWKKLFGAVDATVKGQEVKCP